MFELLKTINLLFIATNADKISVNNAIPNMADCYSLYGDYVKKNVAPSCLAHVFSLITTVDSIDLEDDGTRSHLSLALDTCNNETYIYLQIGECTASRMKKIDSATVPDGFFKDYYDGDMRVAAVLNYVRSMDNCPPYFATVNNSRVLHTGDTNYSILSVSLGELCFGPWAVYDQDRCDPSLSLQPVNTPNSESYSTNLIAYVALIGVIVLYAGTCAVCICLKNNANCFLRNRATDSSTGPRNNNLETYLRRL